ncbi:phage holin family protein [Methylobacterium gossipiicola]|uniref:Putative Holin-X, holin superfamily III n=1 Tax=Methylobacterium gossipiicola TaxID=582675 RepID=A0A1I2VIW0_9HYPH|nr:phage holin family protein [Methylobacterium gossipiicola]SFG89218.1 Putative Holin-X, holin superfamily III [Methylobacterium gossipiicola]
MRDPSAPTPSARGASAGAAEAATKGATKGLAGLFGDSVRNAADLLSAEFELLRRETDGNIRAILRLVTILGTAVLLVLAAMMLFVVFLVKGIGALLGSDIAGAVVVGGPFAAVALALTVFGLRRMARKNLLPRRFERQIAEDARMATRPRA